jgi:hypothetical protein
MISCNECQKKIAAVYDNEGNEVDERLISAHLEHCPECQSFRLDMIRIRQVLISDPAPPVLLELTQETIQELEAKGNQTKRAGCREEAIPKSQPARYRRFAWIGGLAAAFLIISSLIGCLLLTRKVGILQRKLRISQESLAIAQAEGQSRDERDRQQRAIAALFLRMAELEDRVESVSPPRVTVLPTGQNEFPDRPGEL